MPFVYEKISEEDAVQAHWELCEEYKSGLKARPTRWTIDRDRNVFLWRISRRKPEQPHHIFGLHWEGESDIRIRAIEIVKDTPETDRTMSDITWEIEAINLPEKIESERDLIKNSLKDAFNIFARGFDDDVANVVILIR